MISTLHLLWIVPLSTICGYFIAILMVIAKETDEEYMEVKHENTDI